MRQYLFLSLFSFCCLSVAAVPTPQTDLDIYAVAPVSPEPTMNSDTVAKFIPTDSSAYTDESKWLRQVGRKTIKAITKSDFVKKSAIGKTADTIKASTSTEMATTVPQNSSAIQHKVKFSFDPYSAEARMKYTGFFNCSAFYDAFDGDLKVELTEQIDETSIKIQHSTSQQNSTVLLGWTW